MKGSPSFGLRFTPASAEPAIDLGDERQKLEATIIQFASVADSTRVETGSNSTRVESPRPRVDEFEYEGLEALIRGLARIGYEKSEARELLERAIRELVEEGAELVDERILQQALNPSARPAFEREFARERARPM